jgi:hypothetical protein
MTSNFELRISNRDPSFDSGFPQIRNSQFAIRNSKSLSTW